MSFKKKFFGAIFTAVFLFQAGAVWGARVVISGSAGVDAIDTLTFSGGALSRPAGAPAASEMIIFSASDGEGPAVVRDRIVNLGAGLTGFSVSPMIGNPDEFEVDTEPPGGALLIELNGEEVTSDPESSPVSHAGQRFRLTASQIPTLSEWGLILFAALLLTSLVWFIRRRRKLIKAQA